MSGNEQILAAEYSKSSRAELDHARGAALHQFVHLENQLDIIFEFSVGAMELGGSNYRRVSVAQFAFSKIYNPDIKIQIIKKCLDTYLPDISPTFSKSMVKEFKTLAKMRNLIAHGAVQISVFDEIERHCLVTPRRGIDESSLFPENLSEFVKHAVFMFYVFAAIRDKLLDQESLWLESDNREAIFQQDVVYPPPDQHPIAATWRASTATVWTASAHIE